MSDDLVTALAGILERLRARAQLYKNAPRNDEERAVGRALDEVADAFDEVLSEPAKDDD